MTALTIPAIGSTNWGSDINNNWKSIQNALASVNGLRLSSVSGIAIPSDQSSVPIIYLTPFTSDAISLYSATGNWDCFNTNEVALTLSGVTPFTNYDVFAYWNGTAVALELSTWSGNARLNAISMQNGVWLKSTDKTRRLVGTIRSYTANSTIDTAWYRFIWNVNNQTERKLCRTTTIGWYYATAAWRAANNDSSLRVEVVTGLPISLLNLSVKSSVVGNGTINYCVGIGEDSMTAPSHDQAIGGVGISSGSYGSGITASIIKIVPQGSHYYQWLEFSPGGNPGTSPILNDISGLLGTIWA